MEAVPKMPRRWRRVLGGEINVLLGHMFVVSCSLDANDKKVVMVFSQAFFCYIFPLYCSWLRQVGPSDNSVDPCRRRAVLFTVPFE